MKINIGCDLVKISRIKNLKEVALKKIFHVGELQNSKPEHLAGIFAAKEAAFKALQLKSNQWLDIEIIKEENGRPKIILSPAIKEKIKSIDCSISHDSDYALAFVLVVF